jgi:hypothetical protein
VGAPFACPSSRSPEQAPVIRAYHSKSTPMDVNLGVLEHHWSLHLGPLTFRTSWTTAFGRQRDRERREFDALYDAAVKASNVDVVAWAVEDHAGDRASLINLLRTIAAGTYDDGSYQDGGS